MNDAPSPITKEDLEAALRGLVDDSSQSIVDTGTKAAGIAGAFAFLALAVTYVFGRRRGTRSRPVVEIRRM
jgi:hypothetical protein